MANLEMFFFKVMQNLIKSVYFSKLYVFHTFTKCIYFHKKMFAKRGPFKI